MKFGTYTLPHDLSANRSQPRQRQQVPLPGRSWSYRRDRGGLGAQFTVRGEIRPASQLVKDQIAALADGVARILDLEEVTLTVLEACFRWVTGPTWTDNTIESQTEGGTPFILLGATTDYAYFGHREKFNSLQFTLDTLGAYGSRIWEYSDGAGGWKTLSLDLDETVGFSQNGTVFFTPPSDWKHDTVNSVENKFWIRVHVASVTTAATVLQIEINMVFQCLLADPTFDESALVYDVIGYTLLFLQYEPP
jgi:hypothetical protein